ncbi:MAG: hypothetical protein AAFX99_34920 [Myxococcota bacterium]
MAPHPTPLSPWWMKRLLALERRSRSVDRLYTQLCKLRSDLLVALVPPEQRDAFIRSAHTGASILKTDAHNRDLLFWEAKAMEAWFPEPPARLWVGAAGAGREMVALAARGYDVAGLEPLPELVSILQNNVPSAHLLAVDTASYQDMLAHRPLKASDHAPFDGAILGWLSICHLTSEAAIVELLGHVRALCPHGPVLLSYAEPPTVGPQQRRLRTLLATVAPHRRSHHDFFQVSRYGGGFIHALTPAQIAQIAAQANYRVVASAHFGTFPHAVLVPTTA